MNEPLRDYNALAPGTPEDNADEGPRPLLFGDPPRGGKPPKSPLQPIPTPYGGCFFRSRLEARWAVFFDEIGMEWRYEHEGFILAPFGDWYLPDFYLPEFGYWIEVKPTDPNEDEQRKTYLFNQCLVADKDPVKNCERAFVLHGDIAWPYPKKGNIIGYEDGPNPSDGATKEEKRGTIKDLCWNQCPLCQQVRIAPINTMSCPDCIGELGALIDDALAIVEGIPDFDKVFDIVPAAVAGAVSTAFFRSGHKTATLRRAYEAARSARFEERGHRPSA